MTDPIDLTLERLTRLEQRLAKMHDEMSRRFDGVEGALGKMVTVLEAHDQRLEHISTRLDALVASTLRARTQDTERMADLDRRLRALEERQERQP